MPTLEQLDLAMLSSGRAAPAIHRLGGGQIAMAGTGQPWRVRGEEAVVYQLRQANGRVVALRCPLCDEIDPDLARRYQSLATHSAIRTLGGLANSPIIEGHAYVAEGVTLSAEEFRSHAHPVMAMDWVMGPTLLAAVDRACRAGDQDYLAALASSWAVAIETLSEAGFSHGDLTGDNILVRPGGGMALVDYDTAYWSGIDQGLLTRLEGTLGYRHPTGEPAPAPQLRDNFAALVIYASLRLLARRPDLRERFGDPSGERNGGLLFTAWDLVDPDVSPAFEAVREFAEPDLRFLVETLEYACLAPADEAPILGDVSERVRLAARGQLTPRAVVRRSGLDHLGGAPAASSKATPAPRVRQTGLNHVNSLLRAGEDEAAYEYWIGNGLADADNSEAARELVPRMAEIARRRTLRQARAAAESGDSAALLRIWRDGGIQELGAAASLRPAVEAAGRRQEQVARLREAVEAGDAATVVTLWPQLQGDSLASMLAIQVYEILAGRCGAEIAGAIERRDDRGIIDAVRHAEEAGIAVSLTGRRASRSAKRRLTTRRALQSALATDDRVELAALAISGDLVELGSAEPGEMRTVLRALAWPHLERALESDDDQMIVAAYDAELFDGPGSMTELQRSRVNLARKRLAWLANVRAALRARDLPGLKAVLNVTPLGADRKLSKTERGRIVRLTTRDEVTERLVTALKAGNYVAIVEALNGGDTAGATLPEALAWAAVGGVVNQKTLIDAIRQASGAVPPDHTRLAKLLPAARAAGLTTDPTLGLGREFARLEHEMLRTAAAQRVWEAIAAGDDLLIMTAADPDPYGALELLSTDEQLRVSQARSAREVTARGITAAVRHEVNMATAPADSNASAVVADRPSALRSDARSSLRSLAGPGPGSGNSPRNT